jgi:hypothetical protein
VAVAIQGGGSDLSEQCPGEGVAQQPAQHVSINAAAWIAQLSGTAPMRQTVSQSWCYPCAHLLTDAWMLPKCQLKIELG